MSSEANPTEIITAYQVRQLIRQRLRTKVQLFNEQVEKALENCGDDPTMFSLRLKARVFGSSMGDIQFALDAGYRVEFYPTKITGDDYWLVKLPAIID